MLSDILTYKTRSEKSEIMDDLEMEGREIEDALSDLSWVHRYLGGEQALRKYLTKAMKHRDHTDGVLRIMDVGCGGGDAMRTMLRWARGKGIALEVVGVDANGSCLAYAKKQLNEYPNVIFLERDIMSDELDWRSFDLLHFGLIMHHFRKKDIVDLLSKATRGPHTSVIISDLQRNKLAFQLFKFAALATGFSPMARADGLLSIRKGFTRKELEIIMRQLPRNDIEIKGEWPFKYLVLINPQQSKPVFS